jgi:hypothetical protein
MSWLRQPTRAFTIDDLESAAKNDRGGSADLHTSTGTLSCQVFRNTLGTITSTRYYVQDGTRSKALNRSQAIAVLAHLQAHKGAP